MDEMNYTHFLGRTETETAIKTLLQQFPVVDKCCKRNIYIRGKSGVGKTCFITRILEEMNYDVVHYETSETKNNTTIELITKNTITSNNVISSFRKEKKKHVVLIDDTDSLCISDKTSLTSLIKLVRPKKTKKQQTEPCNSIPIVFVGNMQMDKNTKDLINVCHTFEIHPPTREQMTHIIRDVFPTITTTPTDCSELVDYIGEDLSKLCLTHEYYGDTPHQLLADIKTILIKKTQNADRTQKIHQLYRSDIPLGCHSQFINETDRTTVSLLWHENVVDILKSVQSFGVGITPVHHLQTPTTPLGFPLMAPPPSTQTTNIDISPAKKTKKSASATTTSKRKPSKAKASATTTSAELQPTEPIANPINRILPIYVQMLDNICYSDYIDRTTFQKQVWKLNEISSIIKTFMNNHILHREVLSIIPNSEHILPKEIRFTKILTKYSSEYNNFWFIRNLCQTLGIDKNDLLEHVLKYPGNHTQLLDLFEANEFDMTTLNRLVKYYKVCATGVLPKGVGDLTSTETESVCGELVLEDVN
jgi:hypothetical protein